MRTKATIEVPRGVPGDERETVIQWDRSDDVVTIWTADPPAIRKLVGRGVMPIAESRKQTGELHGYTFTLPLDKFRWNIRIAPKKIKKDLTSPKHL
jgi:hypothetical protein